MKTASALLAFALAALAAGCAERAPVLNEEHAGRAETAPVVTEPRIEEPTERADERRRMAQNPHEYLIEQLQDNGTESVGSSSNKIRLNFNHPCKELIFTVQKDEITDYCESLKGNSLLYKTLGAQPFNYTDTVDALPNAIHAFAASGTVGTADFISSASLFADNEPGTVAATAGTGGGGAGTGAGVAVVAALIVGFSSAANNPCIILARLSMSASSAASRKDRADSWSRMASMALLSVAAIVRGD